MNVACALAPRFRLLTALGERRELLRRPAALAPEAGSAQLIGEVSPAAERYELRAGMRLGEALSRCPELLLVPPDPELAERAWESAVRGLEEIGAEVESERPGEAFFEAEGLRGLWGGMDGVLARARRAAEVPVRLATAPGRFCAYAAARRARPRSRPPAVPAGAARRFLAPLPVGMLGGRIRAPLPGALAESSEPDDLPNELERLGIATLGRLAGLPRDAVADRFGDLGLRAQRLARGGRAAAPARAQPGAGGGAGAARRLLRPAARARPGAADLAPARPSRAPRAHAAGAAPLGPPCCRRGLEPPGRPAQRGLGTAAGSPTC